MRKLSLPIFIISGVICINANVIGLSRISCATKKSSSTMAPSMLQSWASTRVPTTPSPALRTTRLWRCRAQLVAPLIHRKNTTTPMFPSAAKSGPLQLRLLRNQRLCVARTNPATRCLRAPTQCVNTSRVSTLEK